MPKEKNDSGIWPAIAIIAIITIPSFVYELGAKTKLTKDKFLGYGFSIWGCAVVVILMTIIAISVFLLIVSNAAKILPQNWR